MLALDSAVMKFINQFASQSCLFDHAVGFLQGSPMLKGVALLAIVWLVLLSEKRYAPERRLEVLTVLLLSSIILLAARVATLLLPFRDRPLHEVRLHLQLACGFPAQALDGWSSFPSDHAIMYSMLATGIGFASRRLGWAAMAYVLVFVLFPRVYLGLHWPSDILAGVAIGVASAQVARIPSVRDAVGRWATPFRENHPGSFHASLFVWSYLLATHFDELRNVGRHVIDLARHGGL